jgi:hypothetical protein
MVEGFEGAHRVYGRKGIKFREIHNTISDMLRL